MKKKLFSSSFIYNGILVALFFFLVFSASGKGFLIQGLMKIGFFQPKLESRSSLTKAGEPVADILFQNSNGTGIHIDQLRGKVVFINFWATWCPPCIAEMPSIDRLHTSLKDNKQIVFIMVDVDNDLKKSTRFMISHQLHLDVYKAMTEVPGNMLGGSIPTTIILDKTGHIVFSHAGGADYSNPAVLPYLENLALN